MWQRKILLYLVSKEILVIQNKHQWRGKEFNCMNFEIIILEDLNFSLVSLIYVMLEHWTRYLIILTNILNSSLQGVPSLEYIIWVPATIAPEVINITERKLDNFHFFCNMNTKRINVLLRVINIEIFIICNPFMPVTIYRE